MPSTCPSCGSPVVREEGEVAYRCVSIDCPAQAVERLIHWGSRKAMDIDGLGDEIVARMVEQGLLADVADFSTASPRRILPRSGPGARRSTVPTSWSAPSSRQRSWLRWGSPGIAVWRACSLAWASVTWGRRSPASSPRTFGSMAALAVATEEDIAAVDGIGPKIAASVREFFQVPKNVAVIERLREAGVVLEEERTEPERPQTLAGLTFVLTGTLERLKRDEAKAALQAWAPRSRARSPRRRATSWPVPLPAPSSRRPRAWASPSLTRRRSSRYSRPASSRRRRRPARLRGAVARYLFVVWFSEGVPSTPQTKS